MKNAFVTGGSGFVGRNLIRALVADGYAVRALARSSRSEQTVRGVGAEAVRGDLGDEQVLLHGMSGCATVFHGAARVDDWGPEQEFLEANVRGTERVLQAARAAGIRRLVHVSSDAVLAGGPPIVCADENRPRPRRPAGIYALTKALAEERVLRANDASLSTVAIRPRLVWGKGDTSVLAKMAAAVRAGSWRWISGGRYKTSTCHVANLCAGLILAAERGRGGQAYFVTDGAPVEFRWFVERLLASQGLDAAEASVPRAVARMGAWFAEAAWRVLGLRGRPPVTRGGLRLIGEEVTLDDTKARRQLGYAPRVTIRDGLAEMSDRTQPHVAYSATTK